MNNLITGGNSAASINVRSDILKQPNLLAVGKLVNTANPGTVPFVAVTGGDGSVASSLSDAMLGKQSFGAAGYLGANATSFAGYATSLIADVANRASNAKSDSTTKTAMFNTLQQTYSSETGVNVDQQTAQLANMQTLYAASAKVVSTVNQMFHDLLSALQ
jgi:flagellar hook-associated protein 1 FlgK